MIKLKLVNLVAITAALFLFACKKDDNKQIANLTVDKTELTVKINETATITITSGNGNYTIAPADSNIATASLSANTITVTGKNEGTTTLTLTDAQQKTAQITVKVINLIIPTETLSLTTGTTATHTLTFGSNYTLSISQAAVATATISNTLLTITALSKGETDIVVKDPQTEKQQTFKITVTAPSLAVAQTAITLEGTSVQEIAITSGTPDYTIATSNSEIVTAEIIGKEHKVIRAKGVNAGTATLTLTDAENQKIKISVTVNPEEENTLFEIDDYGVVTLKEDANPTGAIKIPAKGTSLDSEIFYSNKAITSADLNNVTEIGASAFAGTSFLTKVIMPKVEEIGEAAFTTSGLTELTLPATLKSIGQRAFMNNRDLVKITSLKPTPPAIESQTFSSVWNNAQKTVTLYVPKGAKAAYQADENWSKFKNIEEIE